METCRTAIYDADEYDRQRRASWRKLPDDDPQKGKEPPERANRYSQHNIGAAVDAFRSWLESSAGRSFRQRAYFLVGQAGSGKTHLLLDATKRALDAGRPAVFLAGARFGSGDLWASIADQLGLDPVGADVLLRAMDAAGEAAATSGRRFVIFIDALNETMPPNFWRVHLPVLRAAVARYPHVALAVSCRDTYQSVVLEGTEGSHFVRRTHPGFADREVEATQKYFAHYKLPAPKIPLLTPEFTLPLFLRLYCESMARSEGGPVPEGHQGRVVIFERYLAAKVETVARRLRPGATSGYELNAAKGQVNGVLDGLLDELSRQGQESMAAAEAEAITRTALGDAATEAAKVLGLLQEEGILTREQLYLGNDTYGEGVRIVFQAFADFLLLKRRLARSGDPLHDPEIKQWLTTECSWGINEAATALFPEVYGIELPDLLDIKLGPMPEVNEDPAARDEQNRARRLYGSLIETLPYRASQAVTERTVAHLNTAQDYLSRSRLFEVLFMIAPQPGNRLNGQGLHDYLLQATMPERDSDFGFATYWELSEESTPAARLARWAADGPYPDYDAEVIELACILLCWLLSSPNRFMRDWVTKALVQLLHGHLDVMRGLFERFRAVNDPYVVQRVTAIAYGALLRSTPAQATQAQALAELVLARVFTRPIRPDELLLDAARGIARWAVASQLLPPSALETARRPYGLTPPGPPPTQATIDEKYGWQKDQPDHESYGPVLFSALSDFGRYVIQPGLRPFSRYRFGRDYPERRDREPRLIKSRWKTFIASLDQTQKDALGDQWLNDPIQHALPLGRLSFLIRGEDDPLTGPQRDVLAAAFQYPRPSSDEYPTSTAQRWVFRRTLSLGWTPQRFGEQDRRLGRGVRGSESHKSERWGKKYQWMAYHEMLARVADNFQPSRQYDEEPYQGLHQITGDREIDPSLPPIDFRAFRAQESEGAAATAWQPALIQLAEWPPARLDFKPYRGDVRRFLADTASEPTIDRSLLLQEQDSTDWVVLDGFMRQVDPRAHKGWRGLDQASGINTLLTPAGSSRKLVTALQGKPRHELHDLFDSNGHIDCCYVGEVGRSGPTCYHRHDQLRRVSMGGKSFEAVPTVEEYTWEGSILDCSIANSASLVLPSSFIQQAAKLSFDMRGPSLLDADGMPMFTYYEEPGNVSRALLVRAGFLRNFLAAHQLELVVRYWFERMELSNEYGRKHPQVYASTTARLAADLKLHAATPARSEQDLD
jgi:hypothetical protein